MTQEAQPEDTLVGKRVADKYQVVKLLGEGGMGAVYLAEHQLGTASKKVALKTLHKNLSHDAHIKARFKREAGTVAALEHPNTIQVFDFGEMPDGTLYLVMEYVQGQSVADILEKQGPMPPARVENIMRQVCGSLEEAHNHGIIHRDLKPDNVVLCERAGTKDWVEVLDFGIAKRSSEHDPNEAKLTQQGMVLGTPPYMSPEQFTGQPITATSDIYALGVMTYEMLTGRLPFVANTAWEWASKHMTEQPTPIETQPLGPDVPERMRNTIARALAKDPLQRFATVKEFFEALSGGTMHTAVLAQNGPAPAPRAKTEMATPAMGPMGGGPPASAGTPAPFSPPMGAPGPMMSAPAVVPAGPAHVGSHKKSGGGSGLVIGLGALAALLLLGGIGGYFAMRPKRVTPVVATSEPTATPSADTSAHEPEPTAHVADVAPLNSAATAVLPANQGGAVTPKNPTPKPVPTPSIKPAETPKPQPEVCLKARAARQRGSVAAAKLEADCRAQGGTP